MLLDDLHFLTVMSGSTGRGQYFGLIVELRCVLRVLADQMAALVLVVTR